MTAPERYRKKPVVIDAIQWTGDNLRAVICFTDGPPDTRTNHAGMMWEKYEDLVKRDGLKIYTLEGKMNADIGDYIIKGVKGEFYPCKPDIFAATYEPADLAAVPAQVRVRPLDLSNALKHAFISGRVSAGAASSFHADAWVEYDPTESAGYTRILAAIEPQPDPRDEVIARLVEAATNYHNAIEGFDGRGGVLVKIETVNKCGDKLRAALAAAKAVQHG